MDFVKVDDISRPYHQPEIEAFRHAIDVVGRPMVLSLSPGETPLSEGDHVAAHANLWRISDDFWDNWKALREQFDRLRDWTPHRAPGHFPDADMLPLGIVGMGRPTRFSRDEQVTLMTLWSIARSPLIFGGDLTKMDDFTLSLVTNAEVLAVNQRITHNRELFNRQGFIAWVAEVEDSTDRYVALFNARDSKTNEPAIPVPLEFAELGLAENCSVRDLWGQTDLGRFKARFKPEIRGHRARFVPHFRPEPPCARSVQGYPGPGNLLPVLLLRGQRRRRPPPGVESRRIQVGQSQRRREHAESRVGESRLMRDPCLYRETRRDLSYGLDHLLERPVHRIRLLQRFSSIGPTSRPLRSCRENRPP